MEEKINNQKIFSYVPSLVARLILESDLQDKNIFTEEEKSQKSRNRKRSTVSFISATTIVNSNMFPIVHVLDNTIIMNIKLKGFQKLISLLSFKDPESLKDKLFSEYLSLITPKILLKISDIIEKNGGEIVKYNDYEFTTIWSFAQKNNYSKMQRYKKFYAKYVMITAIEIMKYLDETEIACGINIKISIGIAMGKTSIVFFGGERKRSEFIVMGETFEKAEKCLNHSKTHEVIISQEMNDLFKNSEEMKTKQLIENNELVNLYSVVDFKEDILKNFVGFKGMKMKLMKIIMSKEVYDNLANKVYIFSSILPQGLVKYFDVGEDQNLKEISVVTIATINIYLDRNEFSSYTKLQNLIFDIQKATYFTFGSLLYMSKTYDGLLVRCVWGMDPGSFLDDTARAITTAFLLGKLTNSYDIKIGIGLSTGACYTGLISIQGDRKLFTLLGKKVNLSRTLSDEAFKKVLDHKNNVPYIIYCDQITMEQSQKWYRHIHISQIKTGINSDSELYYETVDTPHNTHSRINSDILVSKKTKIYDNFINSNDFSNRNSYRFTTNEMNNNENLRSVICERKNGSIDRRKINKQQSSNKRNSLTYAYEQSLKNPILNKIIDMEHKPSIILVTDIFSPIENEEYFIPNKYDPFPLIRTHLNNSYNATYKFYVKNHIDNFRNNNHEINLNAISPKHYHNNNRAKNFRERASDMNTYIELEKINQKSITLFGNSNQLEAIVKVMNEVTKKKVKQFILVKGPLGVGKSLFVRKALNNYLNENENLLKILYNEDEFIFCNIVNPIISILPYNTISFILRKILLHLKRLNKMKMLFKVSNILGLSTDDLKDISFILSIGKGDIDLRKEFAKINPTFRKTLVENEILINRMHLAPAIKKSSSVIAELEGPYKINDFNKINSFFYEMILIYKEYLNAKKNTVPLIFILDDIQSSDQFSIDFFKYIVNNNETKINPFIVLLVEQIPYNSNFRPLKHKVLELFLSYYEDNSLEVGKDRIISFEIQPIYEKDIIKKILFSNFIENIFHTYQTGFQSIDDKIIDFLLMKSFNGIPLLFITLFESLLKSKKFITKIGSDFVISDDLKEDNSLYDWSDLLLPYVYEKISSMTINSILNFKETLLLKYACTIGTIFDIQTLDKINPLNVFIKFEDLQNIMNKLNNYYILEYFNDFNQRKKDKKKILCKMCFPLMREALHQKFPIEKRAEFHRKIAEFLSTVTKKANYFSTDNEVKVLKRHLIYSEINITEEIEIKGNDSIDSIQNKTILNYNSIKFLVVKELCSKLFYNNVSNVLEGSLEMYAVTGWKKINYYINRRCKILLTEFNDKNKSIESEDEVPLKDIYKNTIVKKGSYDTLEICVSENSMIYQNTNKKYFYFRSDKSEEICKLDIALNFLRVKVNYDKFVYTYGQSRFPLYKSSWFDKKEKKYYMHIDDDRVDIYNKYNTKRRTNKSISIYLSGMNMIDKLLRESKNYKKYFYFLMNTVLSVFLGCIQINLNEDQDEDSSLSYSEDFDSSESEESESSDEDSSISSTEKKESKIKVKKVKTKMKKKEVDRYPYLYYFHTPRHLKFILHLFCKQYKKANKEEMPIQTPVVPRLPRTSVFLPNYDHNSVKLIELKNNFYKGTDNHSSKSLRHLLGLGGISENEEEEKFGEDGKSIVEKDELSADNNSIENIDNNNDGNTNTIIDKISNDFKIKQNSTGFNINNYINNNININVINNNYVKEKNKSSTDNIKAEKDIDTDLKNDNMKRRKTFSHRKKEKNTIRKNKSRPNKNYLQNNDLKNKRRSTELDEIYTNTKINTENNIIKNIYSTTKKQENIKEGFYKALSAIIGNETEENLKPIRKSKVDLDKEKNDKDNSSKNNGKKRKVQFDESSEIYSFGKKQKFKRKQSDDSFYYVVPHRSSIRKTSSRKNK